MSLGSEAKEEQLIADALYEQEQIVKERAKLQLQYRHGFTSKSAKTGGKPWQVWAQERVKEHKNELR